MTDVKEVSFSHLMQEACKRLGRDECLILADLSEDSPASVQAYVSIGNETIFIPRDSIVAHGIFLSSMCNTKELKKELLPCPFCGSEKLWLWQPNCRPETPYVATDRMYPVVRCSECYAEVCGDNEDYYCRSAIRKWNTRKSKEKDLLKQFSDRWSSSLEEDENWPGSQDMLMIMNDLWKENWFIDLQEILKND